MAGTYDEGKSNAAPPVSEDWRRRARHDPSHCCSGPAEKPLIWNVCWKTALYWLVASLIHYLERLYDFWKEAPGFVAASQRLPAEIVWPHFWTIQILLAMLILMY